jgi:hypothetical protein
VPALASGLFARRLRHRKERDGPQPAFLTRHIRGNAIAYHHTQRGTVTLIFCLAAVALDAGIAWWTGRWLGFAVLVVVIAVAILFSSLTVEVNENELRWHFGPGLWKYRLMRKEIASIAVVRNHWWYGFGIRILPGFHLYNVSGLNAVELRLKSGEVRRIGTDDPRGLAAALNSRARGL